MKFSKKKTEELLKEVTSYIEKNLNLKVFDSFSDWGDKRTVVRNNPECPLEENQIYLGYKGPQKYFGVCEFSVLKKGEIEFFVIWDYREGQPFDNSFNCVSWEFGFGRYEFSDRESFYNHINSDFGYTIWDIKGLEEVTTN
jgi:hypothetical protein